MDGGWVAAVGRVPSISTSLELIESFSGSLSSVSLSSVSVSSSRLAIVKSKNLGEGDRVMDAWAGCGGSCRCGGCWGYGAITFSSLSGRFSVAFSEPCTLGANVSWSVARVADLAQPIRAVLIEVSILFAIGTKGRGTDPSDLEWHILMGLEVKCAWIARVRGFLALGIKDKFVTVRLPLSISKPGDLYFDDCSHIEILNKTFGKLHGFSKFMVSLRKKNP